MKEKDYLDRMQPYLDEFKLDKVEAIMHDMTDKAGKTDMLSQLLAIYRKETEADSVVTVFDKTTDIDMLTEQYVKLKLLLRRIEFDMDAQEDVVGYCMDNRISAEYLAHVIEVNMFFKNKVTDRLSELFKVSGGELKGEYISRLKKLC